MSDNRNSRDIYSSSRPRSHTRSSSRSRSEGSARQGVPLAEQGTRKKKKGNGKRIAVNAVLSVVLVLCILVTAVAIKYPNAFSILFNGLSRWRTWFKVLPRMFPIFS